METPEPIPTNYNIYHSDETYEINHNNRRVIGPMSYKQQNKYLSECNCSSIIYDDFVKYMFENKEFKQHYEIAKYYPNLRSNNINKNTVNKKTVNKNTVNNSSHMVIMLKMILNENRFDNKHSYIPERRSWYCKDCQNPIDIYEEREYANRPRDNYFVETIDCNVNLNVIMQSCVITFLFETMANKHFIHYFHNLIEFFNKFEHIIKKKLLMSKDNLICSKWKTSDYYYKKLFFKSIYLDDLPTDLSILKLQYDSNFEALICGHPSASNGWFHDGLQELIEMDIINE